MTVTICLPATEVISIDAMSSVDTVVWSCRLCDHHGTATTRPTAHSESVEHLTAQHHATIDTAPPAGRRLSPAPVMLPVAGLIPAIGR